MHKILLLSTLLNYTDIYGVTGFIHEFRKISRRKSYTFDQTKQADYNYFRNSNSSQDRAHKAVMVSALSLITRRTLSSVQSVAVVTCTEVSIPVPWGAIAGKHWTHEAIEPGERKQWIVLHGLLDNAGSFDGLAPLLTSACPRHSLLCLDYPGHGDTGGH